MKTLVPENELARIEALHRYKILHTPPEAAFDEISRLAAALCDCPIAAVNFVGANKTWAKSLHGISSIDVSREKSFCAHTVVCSDFLEVADAGADERFSSSPLAANGPKIRYYLGVSLTTADRQAIGTLCVMDTVPRQLAADKPKKIEGMKTLARQVMNLLQSRLNTAENAGKDSDRNAGDPIDFLQTVGKGIRDSADLDASITSVLRIICDSKGWAMGEAWIFNPETQTLQPSPAWHAAVQGMEEFRAHRETLCFKPGKDLPGGALFSGQPVWIRDLSVEGGVSSPETVKEAGLKTAVAVPVFVQSQVAAVIEFFNLEKKDPDPSGLSIMELAAAELGRRIEYLRAIEGMRESDERYSLAAQVATEGLWDWNLKTKEILFSARWKAMIGYDDDEIGTNPEEWFKRVHPQDMNRLMSEINMHLSGSTPNFQSEFRLLHKFGTYRWMSCKGIAAHDSERKAYRMTGSLTDINERKIAEEQLIHDALYDTLTQLPNRALFVDRLGTCLGRAKRKPDYRFAVVILDLDRFKVLNDSLGHSIGDQLLVATARRLGNCIRPGDTVARLGGDEFAILLEDMKDTSDATAVPKRIINELAKPFNLAGQEVFTTVSMGISVSNPEYRRPDDLLRDADTALYRAKILGKGRYEVFDSKMHAGAVILMELEADLRKAVERHEFQVYYQPIVSLSTGEIEGSEALLRWRHPERGLVSPGEFIPLAEETRLIEAIGEWLLRTACAQNKRWRESGFTRLRLAVNFSALQFEHSNLPQLIGSVLKETGLDPDGLEVEITESIAMKDVELTVKILSDLKKMGVGISLDDFGTGYSSLASLSGFPISHLKINHAFLKNLEAGSHESAISKAIIHLAHSLKLKVVAESVETEEQLKFLRAEHCDELQGYLFSPPVPDEEFTRLLQEKKRLKL